MEFKSKSGILSRTGVRLFTTCLVLGVVASLIFGKTPLHSKLIEKEDLLYSCCFLGLVVVALVLYWIACVIDPGYVPIGKGKFDVDSDEEGDVLESDHMLVNGVKIRRCGFCSIEQPLRSRHCEDCNRCVRKFDHHCPWLASCVGENNHKVFCAFLLAMITLILWAAVIVFASFVTKDSQNSWTAWLGKNILNIIDCLILIGSGFIVGCLLCIHCYLAVTNVTTWEFMSRERISYLKHLRSGRNPFHVGYCNNLYSFLCRMRMKEWEKVYNKSVEMNELRHDDDHEEP